MRYLGVPVGIGGISGKIRVHVQFDPKNDLASQKSRHWPIQGAPQGPRYRFWLRCSFVGANKRRGQHMGGYFEIWCQPGILRSGESLKYVFFIILPTTPRPL